MRVLMNSGLKICNTNIFVACSNFLQTHLVYILEPALKQVKELTRRQLKTADVDRGYRGNSEIGETKILIPKPFNDKKINTI